MKLRVDCSAAFEHTISLGERSRFHKFEHLNSSYTEGNETLAEEKWAIISNPVESGGGLPEQAEQMRKLIISEPIVLSPDVRPNLEAEQLEEIEDMEAATTHPQRTDLVNSN